MVPPDPRRVGGDSPTHPGRIVIKDRVIVKVAEQASAEMLGVDRGDVSVEVSAARGGMAVSVASPLPVPALDETDAIRSAGPILQRVKDIQTELGDRISHLTGRDVTRVDVRVTGARVAHRRRVQ